MNGDLDRIRSQEPLDLWPEIERRLSQPAPRPRFGPARVATIAAVALLASGFGWALFALRNLSASHETTVGATGIARIQVPSPQQLVAGEGAVWVVGGFDSEQGGLYRIDPATNEAVLVPGTAGGWWPAVGEGFVWLTTCHANGKTDCAEADLLRIDPSTSQVTATLQLPGPGVALAAGLGSVWISGGGELYQVDPQSMQLVSTYPINANLLAISGGSLWATVGEQGSTGLAQIDPATGEIAAQVPFRDPCILAASEAEVLVASCQGGLPPGQGPDRLTAVDPTSGKELFDVPLDTWGELSFAEGSPWISAWSSDSKRVEVRQLDPGTGLPTGVQVSVDPGPEPWGNLGPGAPAVFTAVENGSFWLTHVDANDVVRVGISSAASVSGQTGPSASSSETQCTQATTTGDFDGDGTLDHARFVEIASGAVSCDRSGDVVANLLSQRIEVDFGSGRTLDVPFTDCQGGLCAYVFEATDLDGDGRDELAIDVSSGGATGFVEFYRVDPDGIRPLIVDPPGDVPYVKPGPAILGGGFDSGLQSPVECEASSDGTRRLVSVHAQNVGDSLAGPWEVHTTTLALRGDHLVVESTKDSRETNFAMTSSVFRNGCP